MEIDLNLDNYNLAELLNLFKLKNNFNIDDLKTTKKIVMKLHPDKSGLDKEYFLFYCKAFRMLKQIYEFRNKNHSTLDNNNSNINYTSLSNDIKETDESKEILIEELFKKDKKDFQKWFNESFEKFYIVEDEKKNGYGDWFKSNEDIDNIKATKNMMNEKINEKREKLLSVVKKQDILEIGQYENSQNYKELDTCIPECYSSNLFSNLSYEDLRKAHTETVVPVSQEDYNNVKKFNNVESYRKYRNSQNIKPFSQEESNRFINNKNNCEDKKNITLAYKLAREDEKNQDSNKLWWSNLRLLK